MHSKSASGWASICVSDTVYRDMKPRTFSYLDSLVATTTSEQIRPGDAFTFGLVAFKNANPFPFAGCLFVVSILPFLDTNICIKGCHSKHRPR
jgi:hypothetical protein